MGSVYLAKQTDLGRQVVVKVMHEHVAADAKFHERFQRETLLMARFQHPNVVALYDASLNDPQGPCIVMEYIRGITLDTLMHRNGRLTRPRGSAARSACEVLQAAHSQGIIHRDLKPANLMVVDPDTPYEKIKVMDFGLAKLMDHTNGIGMMHRQTETGLDFAVGTPGYISPEQVRGEEVDYRSDLYSVGVILFELLTGKLPFVRDETMDVLFAACDGDTASFRGYRRRRLGAARSGGGRDVLPGEEPGRSPTQRRELAEKYNDALARSVQRDPAVPAGEPAVGSAGEAPPAAKTEVIAQTAPTPHDANMIVHQMEAWMPDAIATFKLRGFVQDIDGEVLESVPGMIRVRIGGGRGKGAFAWLGLGRWGHIVDVELRLVRNNPKQQNLLHIVVMMSSPQRKAGMNAEWRERCSEIFCELHSYLAAARSCRIRNQESGVRGQGSEVRGQKSEVRSQKSEPLISDF